jgi:hypothetical protein
MTWGQPLPGLGYTLNVAPLRVSPLDGVCVRERAMCWRKVQSFLTFRLVRTSYGVTGRACSPHIVDARGVMVLRLRLRKVEGTMRNSLSHSSSTS